MSVRLDLRTTFVEALEARGVPTRQRGPYLDVLVELGRYLEARAPRLWSTSDLEQFMVERAPKLTTEERPYYGATLALLDEILASASRKEVDLYLHLSGGGLTHFDLSSGKHRAPARAEPGPPTPGADDSGFSLLDLDDSDVQWPSIAPVETPRPTGAAEDLELGESNAPPEPLGLVDTPPTSAQLERHPGNISDLPLDDGGRIEVDYDDDGELDEPDTTTSASHAVVRPQSAGLKTPSRARRGGPRIGARAELPGWKSPVKIVEDFGDLIVDDRYLVTHELPERDDFGLRATKRPREVDEYVASHRRWLIVAGALLLVGVVGFLVSWPLGLLLTLASLATFARFGLGYRSADAASRRPLADENPMTVAREYIAALRLGLYHRAREMLALPHDATAVSTEELLANDANDAFGSRFNTLSPAMLRVHWAPRIATLDDDKLGLAARLWQRLATPHDVEVNEILRRDDASAAVLVVEAGAADAYAVVPVVRIDGVWYIADGQCRLRSVRVDRLRRLGRQHVNGKIDDDGFVAAFRRHNLTRADITRGRLEGVLSEAQASLLARDALGVDRQSA